LPTIHQFFAPITLFSLCTTGVCKGEAGHAGKKKGLPKAGSSAVRVAVPAIVEVGADGLNFPTTVELDDSGRVLIGPSDAGHGNPDARPTVLKVDEDGTTETILEDGLVAPLKDLLWYDGTFLPITPRESVEVGRFLVERGRDRSAQYGGSYPQPN